MAKEKINPESVSQTILKPRPPSWVMDILIANLIAQGGAKAKIAMKITSLVIEYEKKCSQAHFEMLKGVQELLEH